MSEEQEPRTVPVTAAQMFPTVSFKYKGASYSLPVPDGDDEVDFTHHLHQRALRSVLSLADVYKDFRMTGRIDYDIGQVHRDFAGHAFDWRGQIWAVSLQSDEGMGYLFWLLLKHDKQGKGISEKEAIRIFKAQNLSEKMPDGSYRTINRLREAIIDQLLNLPNSPEADRVTMGA